MPWSDADHGGFAIVEPWLPVDERHLPLSVSEQEDSKGSTLRSVRQFINWRKQQPALIDGDLDLIEGTGEALVFTRSCDQQKLLVAINMTGESIFVQYSGEIQKVHTEHGFTGRFVDNQIELPPYQALYADLP
jgi:alpha-glucosidase